MTKKTLAVLLLLSLATVTSAFAAPTKSSDFKGTPPEGEWTFGVLAGLGILGSEGFALEGAVAKKIIHHGFVSDINNQVFIEGQFGPVFGITGVNAWSYSAHLRWDFPKDPQWTFYALGGVGGDILSSSVQGGSTDFNLYPRFGLGVFYYFDEHLAVRGELSHELTAVGISYRL